MKVSVDTGSRLHLGFTNLSADIGRGCGSIGVAIDRPSTGISLEDADGLRIVGGDREAIRAVAGRFADECGVEPAWSITIRERVTRHVGLGSGTQLTLAVGAGLAALCGIDVGVAELAGLLRRGRRSGVGIAAFQMGGLVVDGGRRPGADGAAAVPTVLWRHDVPADWVFVVVIPAGIEGLSGQGEEGVFARLASSVRTSEEISRLTLLRLMPALAEGEIEEFGRALTAIDRKTGDYFADFQAGPFSHSVTGAVITELLREGALGAGQSSWGPAVYGLAREKDAASLAARMEAYLATQDLGGAVHICHGRNTGARVEISRDDS